MSARGECYVRPNVQDVVFGYIHFSTGQIGHLHLSWLDPDKMRKMTVVGTRKMAVFDDMEPDRKVTVHDKGEIQMPEGAHRTHTGDIWSPRIDTSEPLRARVRALPRARREPARSLATGVDEGVRVVEVLEAMQTLARARRRDDLARGGRAVMWPADEAPGLVVAPDAAIGAGVLFGANVTVHEGTVVGDGCAIGDNAVLGKQPVLSARSTTARRGRTAACSGARCASRPAPSSRPDPSSGTAASSATWRRCASG